ncbi:MAG: hypothetical protein PHQ40_19940 [Anaerolineaceae bacterium]|nr:hypothetical protein [Anaerolineaceae bacterium]
MLNEIAIDLYNQLARKKTQENLTLSTDDRQDIPIQLSESSLAEDLLDQLTTDDPNWMAPPPIPSYGKA